MTEPERTGYRESPDTADGPVAPGAEQVEGDAGDAGDATLTTDADAQHEDSVARPGNQSD